MQSSNSNLVFKQVTQLSTSHHSLRFNWLSRMTSHLSISSKIAWGYSLAFGLAVVGTTVGIVTGNHYQNQARTWMEQVDTEKALLNKLFAAVLLTRTHQQQFGALLQQPEVFQREHTHFVEHISKTKKLFAELQTLDSSNLKGLQQFLQDYDATLEAFFQETESTLKQIDATTLKPDETIAAQQVLLNFTNSEIANTFDDFSDDLTTFISAVDQQEKAAEQALFKAEAMRMQIIVGSIMLSIVIAVLVAIHISRAIARPLQAVTQVAQRVTQDSNFDLQAPVTTTDEVGVLADSLNHLIQEVKRLLEEQKSEAAHQLIQSEKMSSLGRMIAGVAHEINNPVNFIYGNLEHIYSYTRDFLDLLNTYSSEIPNPPVSVQDKADEIDVEFLKEDLSKILDSMKVGAERVRQIVLSLKDFSRLDEAQAHSVDLHACIDSTLLILNNRLKKEICVTCNYGELPLVDGYASALYQVFMNILSNAIDALEEKRQNDMPRSATNALEQKGMQLEGDGVSQVTEPHSAQSAPIVDHEMKHPGSTYRPSIVITTEQIDQNQVTVTIADNGPGISAEDQAKIFETFFTTKPRGVGTGLGLSISHQIVVDKHQGQLSCQSEVGQGTAFMITLPIRHTVNAASAMQRAVVMAGGANS